MVLGVACVVVTGVSLATAAASVSRTPRSVVLRASQVGPGYRAEQVPVEAGSGIGSLPCVHAPKDPLKGVQTFAQSYVKPGSPAVFNVVARYPSAAALAANIAAERRAMTTCPVPQKLRIAPGEVAWLYPARLTAPHLLSGSIAQRDVIFVTVGAHTSTHTVFGIYQTSGPILSFVQAGGPHVSAAEAVILHAAEESASNLR